MSIADKLAAIAENQPTVYTAGKLAVLQDSKYLNARVSGTAVAVNDVSAVEHNVSVQLSGDTISDFSAVAVKRYGKNLVAYPHKDTTQTENGITFTDNGDGTVTANGTATADAIYETSLVTVVNNTYTVSGCPSGGSANTYYVHFRGYKADTGDGATFTRGTIPFPNYVEIVIKSGCTVNDLVFKPQIEIGAAKTTYEPYRAAEVYQAEADGTVNGVKSLSPSMTLTTDTGGVTINCSYLRDIDIYIDNLNMNVAMTGGN